jgi:hypothetical protein
MKGNEMSYSRESQNDVHDYEKGNNLKKCRERD